MAGTGVTPAHHAESHDHRIEPPDDRAALAFTDRRSRPRALDVWVAGGAYLLISVLVWWNVWSHHPTSTTICGCGDSSLFTWFFEWPAYAMSHGLNPLYSTAMGYPHGVNLLTNTAELGVGVPLAPITWVFGSIATLNVALTLSPFLSALAMYVLLRRWVSWNPAAFVGGLLYGFSPYLLFTLTNAHLMLGMAFVPPLVVACLDEVFVRQHARPVLLGLTLALLVAVQFFVGTEVLVIMLIAAGIGVVLMMLFQLWHKSIVHTRVRYALVALGTALVSATVALAYPLWFDVAGPAHLSGNIWGPNNVDPYGGTSVGSYLLPAAPNHINTLLNHDFGGYQAPTFSAQYFGIGIVVVLIAGVIVWRRDMRLWLFGAIGLVSVVLSFGLKQGGWTPWRLLVWLPETPNIIPMRFLMITYLAAAILLGVIVDHTHAGVIRRRTAMLKVTSEEPQQRRLASPMLAPIAGALVAAIALVPIASFLSGSIPLTTQPTYVPTWFRTIAPHLPGHQVLLVFPAAYGVESSMTWQVVAGMDYSMVNQGGPGGALFRLGREASGATILDHLSYRYGPPPTVTRSDIVAVRRALSGWGVTTVVLPDQKELPPFDQVPSVTTVATLMTAAIGRPPVPQANAWVWTSVNRPASPAYATESQFLQCTTGGASGVAASVDAASVCVLSSTSLRQ
jgi:hypothetical protein